MKEGTAGREPRMRSVSVYGVGGAVTRGEVGLGGCGEMLKLPTELRGGGGL